MSTPARSGLEQRAVKALLQIERAVFFIIGVALFACALIVLVRAAALFVPLIADNDVIGAGTNFLDRVLLVLMIVEIAYTVLLSLRGAVLVAEPFLIVGLIAVIRRILVITVGEVKGNAGIPTRDLLVELGVQTAIVLAFVIAIAILRVRPRTEDVGHLIEPD